MIEFDKQRKGMLQQHVPSLKDHERSISSFDDIIKLISDNAIQKWERDIKKRQRSNIAQKDDVLLEVKDLYINQMITYLNGNSIFQRPKQNNDVIDVCSSNQQNALQDILKLFLCPDYSYRLKCINSKSEESNNDKNTFVNQSNQCQILGILAEGGTGKSMFIKKIEILLIEKLTKLSNETETGNYLPILVKCNSLDPKDPSLEEYLKQQGINEDMVQSLKQNDRNKLILLDGYDEYTGDNFHVYSTLKIKEWKNTKVVIATRKEKLSEKDAVQYFSKQNKEGEIDEMSYTLVKLEEFSLKDVHEYAERYFRQERKLDQLNLIEKDQKNLRDCLTNVDLEKLLHLPINLYLFTRMLIKLDDKEIHNLKSNVSDQIGIQETFFSDQFEREAQSFIDAYISSVDLKKDKTFRKSIKNCYFEYFQTVGMLMFQNKGAVNGNYLQVEKKQINFSLSQSVTQILKTSSLVDSLLDKIKNYINSKIITRVKSEEQQKNQPTQIQQNYVEFKHKSLYEYFVARAMKYDFDIHEESIYTLKIEELEQFKINQKSIMNIGLNQSEQQVLIKLYKLMKNQIESEEFCKNYCDDQIQNNNRYIQYLKRSQIQTNAETSKIDIGASNLISALFISKFSFANLSLSLCSFSKAYINTPKSHEINLDRCNFQDSYLKNSNINFDSCNIQSACFEAFSKVFDVNDIYSFQKIIWGKNDILYTISESGFINAFKVTKSDIQLFKSKQLSQTSLYDIQNKDDNFLLVSSEYTLFLFDCNAFEILSTRKFPIQIICIRLIDDNIVVELNNKTKYKGNFKDGFQQLNNLINLQGSTYDQIHKTLITYQNEQFSLYNINKNYELIQTIKGHSEEITSASFSIDGKYIATGSKDKTCKIWNAEKDFELIHTIEEHTQKVQLIAFSSNGKYFATCSFDESCKIWNINKGFELIKTLELISQGIKSVTFSVNGKYLAVGFNKGCQIWDIQNNFQLVNTIQGHHSRVNYLDFSANGKYLATGSGDKTCKIWNAEKKFELSNTIHAHNDKLYSVAFSANGKYLATASKNTCKIWNEEKNFEFIKIVEGHSDIIRSIAFSVDGKYLATGSDDKTCKIWGVDKDFELINTIKEHTEEINFIAFSADGKYFATGSSDQTCKIWNVQKSFELINTLQYSGKVSSVAFSADGKHLAAGSQDTTCKIWSLENDFDLINTVRHAQAILCAVFSANGKYLATGSLDKTCKIWNVEKSYVLINTITEHSNGSWIYRLAFSPNGSYLAISSGNSFDFGRSCKVWNVDQVFEIINSIQAHTEIINCITFSSDRKYLATCSGDVITESGTCKIWNVEKGFELINTISEHSREIKCCTFSSDNKYLVTGSFDKTCKIWDVEKKFGLICTIQGHTGSIVQVVFSIDGKYLATRSDKTCKVWNANQNFDLINTLQKDFCHINFAFSVDGKYLITNSIDKSFKIWDTQNSFDLISTSQGHAEIICDTLSFDGKYLALCKNGDIFKLENPKKGFELIHKVQEHEEFGCGDFSSNGKYLATISKSQTCKVWNTQKNFELIYTIFKYNSEVNSIGFSVDGKYLVTSQQNKCLIWDIDLLCKLNQLIDSIYKIEISSDKRYILIEKTGGNCQIYDSKSLEIINEVINEQVKEKYQFYEIKIDDLSLIQNLYII